MVGVGSVEKWCTVLHFANEPPDLTKLRMTFFRALTMALLAFGQARASEISPVFYGQNHWLGQGDEGRHGYLHLLWPAVKASGVQLVRIGGNAYNVTPPSLDRWTAMVDSVQAIGAEPLLQVPYSFTAEQAAGLVAHFNAPGRLPVRYWSIGNEPMLHGEFSLDEVHAYLMRIASALREADPSIKILIFDEAWMRVPVYEAFCGGSHDLTGKDEKGRWLVDGFTFHSYPNGASFTREDVVIGGVQKIRHDVEVLVGLLEKANVRHGRTGSERLSWSLTEVNVTYANPDREIEGFGNASFLAGQFMAAVFGIGLEHGALTIAPWCINETDAVKTDFGYLGLPPDFAPRSSYYHTQMMAENLRGSFMRTVSGDPLVALVGARERRQIALLVMNQDQAAVRVFEVALRLDGEEASFRADAQLGRSFKIEIAPQSSQVYVLDAKGGLIKKVSYGIQRNLRNLPPVVERW